MTDPNAQTLLRVLHGEKLDIPPLWLMRQAGRYLPEYRALRTEKGGFLELVYDSPAAAEITLQPLRRFGFDGSILFSDILIVPYALGQDLWFEAGEGPRLAPPLCENDLAGLTLRREKLAPIYETVKLVKAELPQHTTFLGFAGSPWTVATYMVAGAGSKDHGLARRLAYGNPVRFGKIIHAIIDLTVEYLAGQVESGVEAIQLFDSWSGSLSPLEFDKWVIEPNRAIVEQLRVRCPGIPIIGFPKGAGGKLAAYAQGTGVDAIGLDETVDPHWANQVLPKGLPVQGNLDPLALIAGGEALKTATENIVSAFVDRPHIFNLGHGILPDTPIEHVEMLIKLVRKEDK
ncbi:uroporphyrinogen decarboxylase [Rhizorhapis sp. SPR117]|uniref:uroporphyrinogen decarboxylase n=1 Tax=Rhizorhapis sp. SPR117 TaxID=2912611 RepID=UPI001EFF72E4|nr:uroporphyrinogen decarboxylase [Rhizorhapis sp. SPR117]